MCCECFSFLDLPPTIFISCRLRPQPRPSLSRCLSRLVISRPTAAAAAAAQVVVRSATASQAFCQQALVSSCLVVQQDRVCVKRISRITANNVIDHGVLGVHVWPMYTDVPCCIVRANELYANTKQRLLYGLLLEYVYVIMLDCLHCNVAFTCDKKYPNKILLTH